MLPGGSFFKPSTSLGRSLATQKTSETQQKTANQNDMEKNMRFSKWIFITHSALFLRGELSTTQFLLLLQPNQPPVLFILGLHGHLHNRWHAVLHVSNVVGILVVAKQWCFMMWNGKKLPGKSFEACFSSTHPPLDLGPNPGDPSGPWTRGTLSSSVVIVPDFTMYWSTPTKATVLPQGTSWICSILLPISTVFSMFFTKRSSPELPKNLAHKDCWQSNYSTKTMAKT